MGEPKFAPSILNCTEPPLSNVPAPGDTVAVKVTDCPKADGLTDEFTVVVVFAWLTTCPPLTFPLLPAKFGSPAYVAVIVCVPTVSAESWIVALPPLRLAGEPKLTPSTANCTIPPLSKVPEPGAMVAVNVTA